MIYDTKSSVFYRFLSTKKGNNATILTQPIVNPSNHILSSTGTTGGFHSA